jgi:pimeloyl-ACP methyl ester carboxylesterase
MSKPTIFFLHALGASSLEWNEVVSALGNKVECVPLDLPGFGSEPLAERDDVERLADWVCEQIRGRGCGSFFLVGHSMGGKIAAVIAARSRDGKRGLAGLLGLALIAASPPGPEPMDEKRRQEMLSWLGPGGISPEHAQDFLASNVARPLAPAQHARALKDIMRSDPAAWKAWLTHGSNEDWADAVGTLPFAVRVLAGQEDGDLGQKAQRSLNVPHYPAAQDVIVLRRAAHLLPYERAEAVASVIEDLLEEGLGHRLPDAFIELLNSERVSERMRSKLVKRNLPPARTEAGTLSPSQLETLSLLCSQVLPGIKDPSDLARRIDLDLAHGVGDGWRFADLPGDQATWQLALDLLAGLGGGFSALAATERDGLLGRLERGDLGFGGQAMLSPDQIKRWFEDARALIARTWTSLPSTWAAMGYDGFAVNAQPMETKGYELTGENEMEAWQVQR